MNSQTKKASKKTKAPPNEGELEAEFYAPQRAKSSRATKPPKDLDSQDPKSQDLAPVFNKHAIPFIDKNIFIDNSLEAKEAKEAAAKIVPEIIIKPEEPTESTVEETIQLTQEIPQSPENTPNLLNILEDQYHPDKHLFREKETRDILDWISKCIKENSYSSLLVSGPPGTGKTIVLKNMLQRLKNNGLEGLEQRNGDLEIENSGSNEVNIVNVNASYSETLSPIVLEMIKAVNGTIPLSVADYKNNAKTLIDKLKQIMLANKDTPNKKLTIVFIDEVDLLLSKLNLAKEIVELLKVPKYPGSNLIIILASNISEIVEKLYELHKIHIETEQTTFEPYTVQERKAIIKSRLSNIYTGHANASDLSFYDQLDLDICIDKMELLNAKDTDPRHILRVIRRAYNQKKEVGNASTQEDSMQIEPQTILSELNRYDVLKAYEELYDEKLSKVFSSLCQKHLLCLAAILSLLTKKGGDTVVKKDVMNTYNTMSARLFVPKIELIGLTEMLGLLEVYKILELKPKEVEATAAPAKDNASKNPAKNANDEYRVIALPEKIRDTLHQDGMFVNV